MGALSIAGALSSVNHDLLGWWLSERQCDSGGLNGRPEKQPDVCYSWWILSTLSILGRVTECVPINSKLYLCDELRYVCMYVCMYLIYLITTTVDAYNIQKT